MAEAVFTSMLDILLLKEEVTWRFWLGGLLALGSAVGLNRSRGQSSYRGGFPGTSS